jgi:hypothetical protein
MTRKVTTTTTTTTATATVPPKETTLAREGKRFVMLLPNLLKDESRSNPPCYSCIYIATRLLPQCYAHNFADVTYIYL